MIIDFINQSIATFFSQVMAAVGGNTAGPGTIKGHDKVVKVIQSISINKFECFVYYSLH